MYPLIPLDVAPVLNFRTANLSQADNSRSAALSRIVMHRIGRLPAPHRRFWTAVVTHREQIDGRLRRIDSHEMVRQMPLAEVSAMNTTPGESIARDSREGRRRKQGGSYNSQRPHHHLKLSLPDKLSCLLARPHRALRPAVITHGRTIAGPLRRTGHRRSAVADASRNGNAERGNGQRDSG
jgi:hypothetical protein